VPPRHPPKQARHRQIAPGLVNEFILFDGQWLQHGLVGGARLLDAWRVALTRVECLFFRGSPRRWRARHIFGTLTRRPCVSATRAHSSSKVISGVVHTTSWITDGSELPLLATRVWFRCHVPGGPVAAQEFFDK
jgi:hypothetical protein